MKKVIQVKNLKKQFKKNIKRNFLKDLFRPQYQIVDAVKDISLEINQCESVAFLGPNGAGKTTSIKMLTGLIYPTSGEIQVLGYTPFDRKKDFLMQIGLVMGNKAGLNWDLTPKQSFDLLRQIYKINKDKYVERLGELTKLLSIEKFLDTQVRKLSLGERMKMEIVGAILHEPKVLFLDEPTIGLDIISKQKIREFLREIQKNNQVTMLLTSHDMDDIEKVCDRVVVINNGEKVYDNSIEGLTSQYKKFRYCKFYFDKTPKIEDIKKLGDFEITEKGEKYFLLKSTQQEMPRLIGEISSEFEVVDIDVLSIPLEEIIADIFNKSAKP